MVFKFKNRSLSRQILSIAFPVMLQNMAFYVMSFTDTAFIGHYKIEGLSAINNALVPFFMIFSFFIALSQGTTIMIAQALGAGRQERAGHIAETSFFYNQLISLFFFLFWLIAGKWILILMGTEGEILSIGTRYIQVLSFMYLTNGFNLIASAVFQGIGKTMPIMMVTFIRAGLNIPLDYILIFGKLGMPELGTTGAALATVISSSVANVIILLLAMRNTDLQIRLHGILRPVQGVYGKVFSFGFQAGLEFMLFSGAQVVLLRMLNQTDPLSAGFYGILNTLINLSVNIYLGVGIAAISLVGKATGADDHRLALKTGNTCVLYSLLVCTLIGTLFLLIPQAILHLFTCDNNVIAKLSPMFSILIMITFPKAVNIVAGNAIRGTGNPRWMLMTQIVGTLVVVALSAHLIFVAKLGLLGIMIANFADEFWRAIVNYSKFLVTGRKKVRSCSSQNLPMPEISRVAGV